MRRLPALLVIAAAVTSGWSTTDDAVVDDSLDSDSTVKTLAINEEDKYQKNLGQASKLDGQFLDDEAKGDVSPHSRDEGFWLLTVDAIISQR